jgi:hypothetical protein
MLRPAVLVVWFFAALAMRLSHDECSVFWRWHFCLSLYIYRENANKCSLAAAAAAVAAEAGE